MTQPPQIVPPVVKRDATKDIAADDEEPIDLANESVAGEEDPGAALTQKPVGPALRDKREKGDN